MSSVRADHNLKYVMVNTHGFRCISKGKGSFVCSGPRSCNAHFVNDLLHYLVLFYPAEIA